MTAKAVALGLELGVGLGLGIGLALGSGLERGSALMTKGRSPCGWCPVSRKLTPCRARYCATPGGGGSGLPSLSQLLYTTVGLRLRSACQPMPTAMRSPPGIPVPYPPLTHQASCAGALSSNSRTCWFTKSFHWDIHSLRLYPKYTAAKSLGLALGLPMSCGRKASARSLIAPCTKQRSSWRWINFACRRYCTMSPPGATRSR
mmetsp:Transcript_25219/g.79130  ORF Transcript_25219/g.79130 Transcript_25219/m.79130 type:complete len:203 (+) Transcript_25219:103-711(+)